MNMRTLLLRPIRPLRPPIALLPLLAVAVALAVPVAAAAQTSSATWDLTDLFPAPEAWEAERQSLRADMAGLTEYRGRLGESAQTLANAYDLVSSLGRRFERLYVYATLKSDEDTRIDANTARLQLAEQLQTELTQATSWMTPELLEVGAERVESFIGREPRLGVHAFNLRNELRAAPHTLGASEEALLSAASLPLGGPARVYNQLSNSDIPWPTIEIDGRPERLDAQGYVRFRQHPDRDVRKRVFDAFWGTYGEFQSSLGQTLAAHVQGHVFTAQARHFEDARAQAMFPDALPTEIYDRLISEVHAALPVLHRYFRLRARMLGVDRMAYYDIYPELVTLDAEYSLEDSKRIALEALAPWGEEYLSILRRGFADAWMHAYPQEGKRSGAYMFGNYDVHPYLLLNHQNDYESLSTFVHEWGHAVHTVLSVGAQPYETYDYSTFVAEMASTINEVLLMRRLYDQATSDRERLFFLARELELYRATYFRQAMFAEFEYRAHQMAENGEPATGGAYTALYLDLLRTYHGHDQGVVTIDDAYGIEWAYIPHFYYNFYVYQYATSVTASNAFVERLLSGEAGVQRTVLDMLRKGGSENPHDIFVEAGVDLTTPGPYRALAGRMTTIMDEIDAILARGGASR